MTSPSRKRRSLDGHVESRTAFGAVLVLSVVGALLRIATLDQQSFWLDELVTVSLVRGEFEDMLDAIPDSEATPYLYYLLAWPWSRVFGLGEIGLRSLSALAGAAIVPVAYGAGAVLVSRRAGLIAACLVAVNPMLVWYAQEARSYSLLALLAALSFLCFARSLQGRRWALLGWGLVSALAIASHYFAIFLVAPEALWLLHRLGHRRQVVVAILLPAVVLAAHLPLILEQRRAAEAVSATPFESRVAGIPKALIVGYSFPEEVAGSVAAAALVAVALLLLARRAGASARQGGVLAGGLAFTAVAVPVALVLIGVDFVVARNMIAAVVPGVVCLAAGYAATRVGALAAIALALVSLGITLSVSFDATYGRTDWRGAGELLEAGTVKRAIVVTPFMSRDLWSPYLPGLREAVGDRVRVSEIAVVGLASEGGFSSGAVRPPRGVPPAPPAGFALIEHRELPTLTFVVYRARRPVALATTDLSDLALGGEQPGVLVQMPTMRSSGE